MKTKEKIIVLASALLATVTVFSSCYQEIDPFGPEAESQSGTESAGGQNGTGSSETSTLAPTENGGENLDEYVEKEMTLEKIYEAGKLDALIEKHNSINADITLMDGTQYSLYADKNIVFEYGVGHVQKMYTDGILSAVKETDGTCYGYICADENAEKLSEMFIYSEDMLTETVINTTVSGDMLILETKLTNADGVKLVADIIRETIEDFTYDGSHYVTKEYEINLETKTLVSLKEIYWESETSSYISRQINVTFDLTAPELAKQMQSEFNSEDTCNVKLMCAGKTYEKKIPAGYIVKAYLPEGYKLYTNESFTAEYAETPVSEDMMLYAGAK